MGTTVGSTALSHLDELHVTLRDDVVSRRVGDDLVLIHLNNNRIFELNESAARLWELLADGASLAHVQEQLGREYDIDKVELERDIIETLESLAGNELVALAMSG